MVNHRQIVEVALISAAAVGISCAWVVVPHTLREFAHAGLEGRYFHQYYGLFLPVLWLFFLALVHGYIVGKPRANRVWWWALAGVLAGYVGGVISITLVGLFGTGGWRLVARQSLNFDDWIFSVRIPSRCFELGRRAFCRFLSVLYSQVPAPWLK